MRGAGAWAILYVVLILAVAVACLHGCTLNTGSADTYNQATNGSGGTGGDEEGTKLKAIGEACSDHAECASSYCVDWVCSATPPAEFTLR